MTVHFLDSCHGGDGLSRWNVFTPASVQSGISPSSRDAYRCGTNAANTYHYAYVSPPTSALVGFYGRLTNLSNDNTTNARMFEFLGPGGVAHMVMTTDSTGAIHARIGTGSGTIRASSSAGVLSVNTWHHFELRCEVADSGGRFVLWVDGNATPVIDFTGDTRNGGADTTVGIIRFGRTNNGTWDVSDIRIGDGTTPLGVTTVWMSLPNGNGNTSTLDGSDGNQVNNFEMVDEATPDDDTTYVFSDTEGDFDLYTLTDLPAGTWDVLAVQTTLYVKTDDGGSKFVRPVLRSGGSNATGASVSVPASYVSRMEVFEDNPVTASPWTESEVDALEVGPEVRDS